jgi:hypothetical protein
MFTTTKWFVKFSWMFRQKLRDSSNVRITLIIFSMRLSGRSSDPLLKCPMFGIPTIKGLKSIRALSKNGWNNLKKALSKNGWNNLKKGNLQPVFINKISRWRRRTVVLLSAAVAIEYITILITWFLIRFVWIAV